MHKILSLQDSIMDTAPVLSGEGQVWGGGNLFRRIRVLRDNLHTSICYVLRFVLSL